MKHQRPEWITEHKARVLLQMGLGRIAALGDTPALFDMVADPTDKQALKLLFGTDDMGRPVIAPPDMPPERLAALREAFDRTMRDPVFMEEAAHENLAVDAMGGSRIFKSPTRKFDPYVVRIQDHALSRVCRKISIWSVSRSSPTS